MKTALGILAVLAGCYSAPATRELPRDHPGNPGAPATAFDPGENPFTATPTYALPPAPSPGHGMHHTPVPSGKDEGAPGMRAEEKVGSPAEYRCPMHPEVVRSTPGTCPECGMELQPVPASGEDEKGER